MKRKYPVLARLGLLAWTALPMVCVAQSAPCPPPQLSVEGGTSVTTACSSATATLAQQYPGDVGIGSDPAVVWTENFEEGSVSAITGRYNDVANEAGMSLSTDKPAMSKGLKSLIFQSSGSGANATHLYKNLASITGGDDEWYVRYYVKYQAGVLWHHTGTWIGGYNPASAWPSPQAGQKPNGDDRFSIAFEPQEGGVVGQLDFYNYWMGMHAGGGTYYGNSILHDTSAVETGGQWSCVEMHVKLNADVGSSAGAELGIWINDKDIKQYTASTPLGYWIQDKFCPAGTTDPLCTAYYNSGLPMVPLDMQFRSTTALKLNYLWLQNYITDAGVTGSVSFDDVVVARRRIGCIR